MEWFYQWVLSYYLDDKKEPPRFILNHLQHCSQCSALYQLHRQIIASHANAVPQGQDAYSEEKIGHIMHLIRQQSPANTTIRQRFPRRLIPAMAMVMLFIVLGFLLVKNIFPPAVSHHPQLSIETSADSKWLASKERMEKILSGSDQLLLNEYDQLKYSVSEGIGYLKMVLLADNGQGSSSR
jgi:hypothetical protein